VSPLRRRRGPSEEGQELKKIGADEVQSVIHTGERKKNPNLKN
jgi:hypothetical protein